MQIPEELRELSTPIDIEGICAKESNLVERYRLRLELEKLEAERQRKFEEWKRKQIHF